MKNSVRGEPVEPWVLRWWRVFQLAQIFQRRSAFDETLLTTKVATRRSDKKRTSNEKKMLLFVSSCVVVISIFWLWLCDAVPFVVKSLAE